MTIFQIKQISTETYASFDDELKIKMAQQQFAYPADDDHEIRTWLMKNANFPYVVKESGRYYWVMFVDESDATAFKLRWL